MTRTYDRFADRTQAGQALAAALLPMQLRDPVVLALPRGGVPVAYEVAEALEAPLDIIMVRKIGAPGHKEYGIGALVDGSSPQLVIDQASARMAGASETYIEREIASELAEIERRRAAYRTGPPVSVQGRSVVVVDDGIATGNTVKAALQALAKAKPARIVLAVPVSPSDTLSSLRGMCDDLVCLVTPDPFYAVGAHYDDFGQISDSEVVELLASARQRAEKSMNQGPGN